MGSSVAGIGSVWWWWIDMNRDLLRAAFAEGFTLARRDATSEETDDELIEDWWSTSNTREKALSSPASQQKKLVDALVNQGTTCSMFNPQTCDQKFPDYPRAWCAQCIVKALAEVSSPAPPQLDLEPIKASLTMPWNKDLGVTADAWNLIAEVERLRADVTRLPASSEPPLCAFWMDGGQQCGRCYKCRH